MNLSEHLRKKTREIRSSLEQLENETLPNLQREKDSWEKDKEKLIEKGKRVSTAISRCEGELDAIGKKLMYLRKRRDQLISRLSTLEGADSYRVKAKTPEARIQRLSRELQQVINDKNRLETNLKKQRIEAFTDYLAEVRDRLDLQAVSSRELSSKRASKKALEEARHKEPEIMEIWEKRVELKRMLQTAEVESNRKMLQQILEDTENSIEKHFPGALSLENQDLSTISEEIFYSYASGGKTYFFLPFDKDDLRSIGEKPVGSRTMIALRLAYAFGKLMSVSPDACKVQGGSHGWLLLVFLKHEALQGQRFSVMLSKDIACPITIKRLPSELEGLVL